MRYSISFLSIFIGILFSGYGQDSSVNPLLADPTIFQENGTYYLYGTTGDPKMGKDKGFLVYTSKDLVDWQGPSGPSKRLAMRQGDAFGTKGFWAPQIFKYDSKYYMAYTADEHIALATSSHPSGPFKNKEKKDLQAPVRQIDPFIYFDDDGKKYLYHVRLTEGNRIFVAELEDSLEAIKPETLKECISGELPWENTWDSEWPVTEGPTILRRKGIYYMIYSANDFRNPDYAVGYATSNHPLGPWTKSKNGPFITKEILGINGTGHGDVLEHEDGSLYYVLHTHFDDSKVQPRRTAIVKLVFSDGDEGQEEISIDKNTFRFLQLEGKK
ncbi:glycoside hydrolase family 43 protein [Euzebyella saccharophila]|uniref:Glycoside hydrolase family 43 protein n=1 Tax=Euzebyella saccharophila TaxID=679664 RepID=A0ABV8JQZ2_9FLAO|nr:glycoside hydrolase family 43 protein [Euzebyella saccharophila]